MPGPYPLPTLSVTITSTGISAPSYADIYASLQATFRIIYGADAYVSPDSQDGQLLAIFAAALNDNNNAIIAAYNSFSPSFAQGAGLDAVVKINGLRRVVPTFSTADGNVVGVTGTIVSNGVVADDNGNLWNLPATVTIPGGGSVPVTVVAQQPGAIIAPAGTINKIRTPTFGWQTFASTTDATPGAPVESDATLRQRQAVSTALPAQTPVGSIYAALANLAGVTELKVYENTTSIPDADGIPGHSISVVISGGDVGDIAAAIGEKKTPGAGTYGTTTAFYTDPVSGIVYAINFFVPNQITIKINITVHALVGYNSNIGIEVINSLASAINTLAIGDDVQWSRLYPAAYLNGSVDNKTYEVTALTIAIGAGTPGVADLVINFNESAVCDPALDVTLTVT